MPHDTSSSSLFGRLSARSSFISPKDVKITVQLLNDADSISNEFKRSQPAQSILDYICEIKNIKEKYYLGLRYQDQNKHRYWVDLSRPISHITKTFKVDSLNLRLRFRFYPEDPSHLRESCSRYQLCVQLQRDLLHGRLYCPHQKAAELAALILQSQLGDFDPEVHDKATYVSEYTLLLKQTSRLEERIAEYHESFKGMSSEEAELEFLKRASAIDTYGFDPYTVKDPLTNNDVFIGVNHRGILIFQANQKIHNIPWNELSKVDYIGRELRILPKDTYHPPTPNGDLAEPPASPVSKSDKKFRLVLKYHCPNGHFAKHLWNHILSQQAFFNEQCANNIKPKFSKPRIPLLSRGSTFRYPSQRVLREIEITDLPNGGPTDSNEISFERYELPRQPPRQKEEQVPWLARQTSHTLPNGIKLTHNNNTLEKDGLDRNMSPTASSQSPSSHSRILFDETAAPSPSTPSTSFASTSLPRDFQSQSNGSCQNAASFTVHLVKYERSPAPSPGPEDSSIVCDGLPDEPLHSSTPLFDRTEARFPKVNGNASTANSNGTAHLSPASAEPTTSRLGVITNTFFASFLILLLLVSLMIAIFERSDGRDWLVQTPWLAHVRRDYYDPVRHYTLQQYEKYIVR